MICSCPWCAKSFDACTGRYNRAISSGAPLYCGMECAGLARRSKFSPTSAEKKESKRIYDAEYRSKKIEYLKIKKRSYYLSNQEIIKAKNADYRKKNMYRHVEYCRQPEYKKWKSSYDRMHLAVKHFGEFAQIALILRDVEKVLNTKQSSHDRRMANGTINKAQMRRREL